MWKRVIDVFHNVNSAPRTTEEVQKEMVGKDALIFVSSFKSYYDKSSHEAGRKEVHTFKNKTNIINHKSLIS